MNSSLQLHPPQPQPPRSSFSCDRHPEEHFTGFCPSCLCERLSGLDPSSSIRKSQVGLGLGLGSSATTAAIKALFRAGPSNSTNWAHRNSVSTKPLSSFFAELRRTKSFSASKGEAFSGIFEPQRRSCDVRARNTLSSLFNQDDEQKSLPRIVDSLIESKEEEIRVSLDDEVTKIEEIVNEIVEESKKEELKPMKDHIDLDCQTRKQAPRDFKEIAGSVWSAASVFSRRLQKWRQKQKGKKRQVNTVGTSRAPVPRETQSEIADYGFGRRSCDTDPRFSMDVARVSFDGFRYSFDEPRASLDGYSGTRIHRLPPMVSVVEDDTVQRTDAQIPVEKLPHCSDEDDTVPGGTAQTRDYYSDSSSRRRKSLDRSSSIRKTAAAVVAEIDEIKPFPNAKVTPATIDYIHSSGILNRETDFRDSNSTSMKDNHSQRFETDSSSANGYLKGSKKPSRWKGWNLWGLIYSRWVGGKEEEDGRITRLNRVERSLSESWPEFRGELKTASNRKILRSNSSVSFRNSGSFHSGRKSCVELDANGWNRMDECGFERNRSARYSHSPNHADNGLWKFYMMPLKGSRRSGNGSIKAHQNHSHSIPRSVLRLY